MAWEKKNEAAPILNPETGARHDLTRRYAPTTKPRRPKAGNDYDREDIAHAVERRCAQNRSGELIKNPAGEPLRLVGSGSGWKPFALIGRNMWTEEEWYGLPGNHSHYLQLFHGMLEICSAQQRGTR